MATQLLHALPLHTHHRVLAPDLSFPHRRSLTELGLANPPEPPVPPDPPPFLRSTVQTTSASTEIQTSASPRLCFNHASPPATESPSSAATVNQLCFTFHRLLHTRTSTTAVLPSHQASQPPAILNRYGNRRSLDLVLSAFVSPCPSSICFYGLICYKAQQQQFRVFTAAATRSPTSNIDGAYPLGKAKGRNPKGSGLWASMSLGLNHLLGLQFLNFHTIFKSNKQPQPTQQYGPNLMASSSATRLSVNYSTFYVLQFLVSLSTPLPANSITDLLVSEFGEISCSSTPWLWKSYIEDSASMASRVQLFDQLSPMVTILDQASASHTESKIEISRNLFLNIWFSFYLCFHLVFSSRIVISTSLAKSLDFPIAIVLRD